MSRNYDLFPATKAEQNAETLNPIAWKLFSPGDIVFLKRHVLVVSRVIYSKTLCLWLIDISRVVDGHMKNKETFRSGVNEACWCLYVLRNGKVCKNAADLAAHQKK